MTSALSDISFFRSSRAGISDQHDPENNRLLNQQFYFKMTEMLKCGDPPIKKSMFKKHTKDLIYLSLISVGIIGFSIIRLYKVRPFMYVPIGAVMAYKSLVFSRSLYRNEVNSFLLANFDLLDEPFQKALVNHDYRYVATYKPTTLSDSEMNTSHHMFFNIN